jgi:hypothetical protein
MGQFIDEDDSSSENILDGFALDEEEAISSEPDQFMQELVDDNELALNELTFESENEELAIADDSDEFMAVFDDAEEFSPEFSFDEVSSDDSSSEELEFSFEETATDDDDFNELMGSFSDDSESPEEEENTDSDVFDLKFEDDDDDHGWAELASLDAIDQKLDELTELSDDSLGELNDLLASVQDDTVVKEEKLNEVHQDK